MKSFFIPGSSEANKDSAVVFFEVKAGLVHAALHCMIAQSFFLDCAKENDRTNFLHYQQNDASECLQFLLEMFHNALSRCVNIDIKIYFPEKLG